MSGKLASLELLCVTEGKVGISKIGTQKNNEESDFWISVMHKICTMKMSDFFAGISEYVVNDFFAPHFARQCRS